MMRLMYDNIPVATVIGHKGSFKVKLYPETPEYFIPKDLFFGVEEVPLIKFLKWIEGRIFPKERVDRVELLERIDCMEYLPLEIASKTRACLLEDGWWVAFSEEDNFRRDTIRGVAGFTEWEIVNGHPRLMESEKVDLASSTIYESSSIN